jgi:hypothetical protein
MRTQHTSENHKKNSFERFYAAHTHITIESATQVSETDVYLTSTSRRSERSLVYASSAQRCVATARFMGVPEPTVIESIYEAIMTDASREAFRQVEKNNY